MTVMATAREATFPWFTLMHIVRGPQEQTHRYEAVCGLGFSGLELHASVTPTCLWCVAGKRFTPC